MRYLTPLALAFAVAAAACGPPIAQTRRTAIDPPLPREDDAARRIATRRCAGGGALVYLLVPGLAQVCLHKTRDGVLLLSLAGAELATGITVAAATDAGIEHPGSALPLLGYQDLAVYSVSDALLDQQRAARLRLVPQDTLDELMWAPFNGEVLRHVDVWAGILGLTALGVGVSLLVDEEWSPERVGEDPNLFGHTFSAPIGYPLGEAIGVGLFEHVAIAEESLFRGVIQSGLARKHETWGWIGASLIFGAIHAPNALLLPAGERADYLLYGVPFITAIGSYLGLSYRWHDYSLAPPVAIHFWYDFLLTTTFFLLDPAGSPLSAGISVPF